MTTFREQLGLLLWKNYILRKRHKVRLVMEFMWPLFLFLILMWVRTRGLKENRPHCHLLEKALPSVGGFEFLQSFICTLNNTCHSDIVEDQAHRHFEKALLPKLVGNATPILRRILGRRENLPQLLSDSTNGLAVLAGIQSSSELRKKGKIKLRELMTKEGRESFLETAPTYTSLMREQLEEFLESELHLNKLNRASFDQLMTDFTEGACKDSKSYEVITVPSEVLFHELCKLERQKAFLLIFLFSNYIDRRGMSNSIGRTLEMERALRSTNFGNLFDNKDNVLDLIELGQVMQEFVREAQRVIAGREGVQGSGALLYEAFCGIPLSMNSSAFGFDSQATTNFDSLRDRINTGKKTYVDDEEVSTFCNMVFRNLHSEPFTNILWRQMKPFIRGKILYSPATPFTQELMSRVDTRFLGVKGVENALNSIIGVIHSVRFWMRNNDATFFAAQEFLSRPDAVNITNSLFRSANTTITEGNLTQVRNLIEGLRTFNFTQMDIFLADLDGKSERNSEILNCIRYNKSEPYDAEYQAVEAGINLLETDSLWAVVTFVDLPKDGSPPKHLKYKIRMDSDKVDGTRQTRDRLTSKSPRRRPTFDMKYITHGFAYLEEMVEHSFIDMTNGNASVDEDVSVYFQQFPYPCYIFDQFIRAISRTFPLFMVLSWVYASAMIVKSIVLEKENRLKEVMKVMGLSNGVIWCGWFIDSFIVMTFSTVVLSVILKFGNIIEHSDFFVILVFMMSFTIATISLSFLVSTFFTRANSAAAAGGILFFVSFLPYNFMLLWEDRLTWYHLLGSSVISNVAFGFGCSYLARLEEDGVGAHWDKITLKTLPDDEFNLIYCILMLLFDSVLYLVLTWYIEAVFPGDTGTPRKWYFFCQKSYWFPGSVHNYKPYKAVPSEFYPDPFAVREPEPIDLPCGVAVTNLGKTYGNGRVALTDLNISFYEGQITSFLGHNGAGKTTTISILTGLISASTGTAKIYGHDIRSEMGMIRKDLGICPQYNVLFDRLTVEEHMIFYSGLKGKRKIKDEIVKILFDLGIPDKKDEFPKNLSGGMKRKLSVAIAFVGGSKTVFLDEPTSGVDPYSRRSIWELLLKYKAGRTIILTTHFMDEADILGDRIAIISQGKLKACGSSLFLKSQFGQGYSLRLVREGPSANETEELVLLNNMNSSENKEDISVQRSLLSSRHTDLLKSFIRHRIPEAILVDDIGSEVVFLLPYSTTSTFPTLFNELDTNLENLRISSYGISDTTLEDVFLRITVEDLDDITKDGNRAGCCCFSVKMMTRFLKMKRSDKNRVADVNFLPEPEVIVHNGSRSIQQRSLHSLNISESKNRVNGATTSHTSPGEVMQSDSPINSRHSQTKLEREHSSTESQHMPDDFPIIDTHSNQDVFGADPNADVEGGEVERLLENHVVHLTDSDIFIKETACKLVFVQYWQIILKRLLNSIRNKKAIFFEMILPAAFIALTLAFTLILPPPMDEAPRELTPWTYPSPNYIFFSETEQNPTKKYKFTSTIGELIGNKSSPIGLGTPCIKENRKNGICHPEKWSHEIASKFNTSRSTYVPKPLPICSCELGSQQCEAIDKHPPTFETPTNDFLLDVSKLYVPEWVRDTYKEYETRRYGGYEMMVRPRPNASVTEFVTLLEALIKGTNVTLESPQSKTRHVYKVWFENKGWVSSVSYLNALHNVLLREGLPKTANQKNEYGITVFTHPLNMTITQREKESLKTAALGVIHAICIIFALSFVPASFTVYLIEERKSGGKHLHLVSGVKPFTYWISNFTFDMGKYVVTALLCILLFYLFDARAYIAEKSFWAFVTLLILYGWASIPLMYPASYLFGIPSTAFVVLACTNLFIGVITTVSTFVLEQLGDKELEEIGNILKQVFLIFPHYCLGRGLIELVKLHIFETGVSTFLMSDIDVRSRFEWEILGKGMTCLAAHGLIFFAITLSCEYKQWVLWLFCKLKPKWHRGPSTESFEDDMDVKRESDRVLEHPSPSAALCAENLTKNYRGKGFASVNKLCFEIEKGECFGLLGVNGAGKTTTFKMLTGDVRITSGSARVMGHDVETSLDSARRHFGYCPQEDGLDPLLDGYEILELYGKLRGMKTEDVKKASKRLVHAFGLTRYVDKRVGTYSGGNKRKVSAAIALIGNPDVIFLDEPTSGMDPGARRQLWKVILRVIHLGKSVVLTTHSMEECEALCTRLAIMVNGRFMCLGSLQHLKNRFGSGYTLTVRCEPEKQEDFLRNLASDLPTVKSEDHHCSQLKFSIRQEDVKLSDIFNVMFMAKASNLVEDYSVSQTTLDDIFVKFASHQRDDMGIEPKKDRKRIIPKCC